MEDLFEKQKIIIFNGSGASHQNGAAEYVINNVVTM